LLTKGNSSSTTMGFYCFFGLFPGGAGIMSSRTSGMQPFSSFSNSTKVRQGS
jgi:hypothetical protein